MEHTFSDIFRAVGSVFSVERLLVTVVIIAVAYIAQRLLISVAERVIRNSIRRQHFATAKDEVQREDTVISIFKTGARTVIWTIAGLTILGTFDINLGPLVAGAGVAGVALGFGAQSIVKDFLAGFFIIAENQYRVGDVVEINQLVSGVVEQISLRQTTLRDLSGAVHYVPNGQIQFATNMTLQYAQVDLNINVSYDSDIDKVENIIANVGTAIYSDPEWKGVALEPAHMLRVEEFAESAITVKIVCKTAPIRQWDVKGELLRRIKKEFEASGIEIPFPQRVLHDAKLKHKKSQL